MGWFPIINLDRIPTLKVIALICFSLCLVLPTASTLLGDENSVSIEGKVTSPEGKPIDATIYIWVEQNGEPQDLASTNTSADGSFSAEVPPKSKYSFYIPSNQKESKVNILPYIPIEWKLQREGRTTIEKDFTLPPAGNLVLKAYRYPDQIYSGALRDITQEHIWSTNINNIPPPQGRLENAGNQYTREHGWNSDKSTSVFLVPLDTPQKLHVQWKVPDFGKVVLEADNGGEGFLFTEKGEQKVISLNYELARTRYRRLKESYESYKEKGYQFSEDMKKKMEKAGHLMERAKTGLGKVLEEEKAKLADKSLRHSLYASEQLEYEKAKQAIDRHKRHPVTIKLVDSEGKALANRQMSYEQTSHNFKFGFELHRYSKLARDADKLGKVADKLKEAGFNLAILTPYHYKIPSKHSYPFGSYEKVLRDKGFDFKIHPVVYFAPWNMPDRFLNLSYSELKDQIGEYSESLAERFSYAKYWELSNEQTHKGRNPFNFTREQILGLLKESADNITEIRPEALFSHNIAFPFVNHIPQPWSSWDKYSYPRYSMHPFSWFQLLKEHEVPVDIFTLQFRPGYYHYLENASTSPLTDLARASRYLDWYGSLGKNIHISEFEVPSNYIDQHGDIIWHRKWDEELQAEYAKKFYTIAFSKPNVSGIIWWLVAYHGKGEYEEDPQNSNLFDDNYEPRPAYKTLKELITEDWTTEGQATTDSQGELSFRGFAGDYRVTLKEGDKLLRGAFHLSQEKGEVVKVNLEQPSKE